MLLKKLQKFYVMKKYISSTLLAILLLLTISGYSQTKTSDKDATNQKEVIGLKKKVDSLQKTIKILNADITNLNKDFDFRETDIKYYVQEKYLNSYVAYFPVIMLVIAIFGLFGTGIYLKTRINEKVHNYFMKYLNSSEWKEALEKKIKNQIAENKFKQLLRIHVISSDYESEKKIRTYFIENEFIEKNISYSLEVITDVLKSKFDILFINNEKDKFDQKNSTPFDELINEIKLKHPQLCVLYYNDNGVLLPRNLNDGLESSFSNSLASLYHNLIDLMRYKYLVIDRKELNT